MSELIQASFDYDVLTPGQAERTQNAELRIIGRTQKAIIENGKDLLAVKADIGHGNFANWLRFIGISDDTAERWMNVSKNFTQIPPGAEFENKALYLLSTSKVPESARNEAKERAESGEKITEELAKQIRDAHKAKEQADEARRKAEEKTLLTQQMFFDEQLQSQAEIKKLNQSIEDLKREMADLSKPEEIIKEVEKPETIARLKQLEEEKEKLTQQRNNLRKLADELSADLDATEEQRERGQRELRVRMEWQRAADTMHKNIIKFLGQLPTPLDTQLFEPDEWAVLDQLIEVFRRGANECGQLHRKPALMIVDAE